MLERFDFIVVGGGSAGCLIAGELSRTASVCLIEAGGDCEANVHMRRPADFLACFGSSDDWGLTTIPQTSLGGRRLRFPRGRGLGGSSRINASIWHPPSAQDMERFVADVGGPWSTAFLSDAIAEVTGHVAPESPRWVSEATTRFLEAARNAGFSGTLYQRMNDRGRRVTAGDRWLGDRNHRLTICFHEQVKRITIQGGCACGVVTATSCGDQERLARKGVILCGGAIASPAILLRSGVGDAGDLERLQLSTLVNLPAVGKSLQDHLVLPLVVEIPQDQRFPTDWSPRQLAQWQALGGGPIASNIAEAGLFHQVGGQWLQLFVTPTDYRRHPAPKAVAAMTIGVVVSFPSSRGSLRIGERGEVAIDPGYWTDPSDVQAAMDGIECARAILRHSPLASWVGRELNLGSMAAGIESYQRSAQRSVHSFYHPVGTCPMGTGPWAVVDPRFRVHGVDHLWIADASVLPRLPASNPNCFVTAIALIASRWIAQSAS